MGRKKIIVLCISAACGLPLLLWSMSLIKCELLTYAHHDEFKDAYLQDTMLPEKIASFKILHYSDSCASVYYVGEKHSGGDVIEFEWKNGKWCVEHWKTVWSGSGSASGVIWPYWWHFIYGGF